MPQRDAVTPSAKHLPKYRILRRNEEFRHAFRHAHYSRSYCGIRLFVCKNNCGYARIGIVVAKKYIAAATQRNRIKRQAREIFRLHSPPLADVVVLVQNKTLCTYSARAIRSVLEKIWPI